MQSALLLLLCCHVLLQEWKKDLASVNPKAADALADPEDYPNLFPGLQVRLVFKKDMQK
jgi:hypothetical protein